MIPRHSKWFHWFHDDSTNWFRMILWILSDSMDSTWFHWFYNDSNAVESAFPPLQRCEFPSLFSFSTYSSKLCVLFFHDIEIRKSENIVSKPTSKYQQQIDTFFQIYHLVTNKGWARSPDSINKGGVPHYTIQTESGPLAHRLSVA
jgi:hypothetical protein